MKSFNPSPRILTVSWGRIAIDGFGTFRDVKLFPGGCREWNWRETGTSHSPGIQPADVEELLNCGARHVVLSRGMAGALGVCPETLQLLRDRGIAVYHLPTDKAVSVYNRLRETQPAGGLFHTTC